MIPWTWQWDKPSKLKAYRSLFSAVIVFVIATIFITLRRRYQAEFRNTQQTSLTIEEHQQQTTVLVESPPPSYEEAVQSLARRENNL